MRTRITIHHLEMTSPDQLIPARPARLEYVLAQAKRPSPAFNRFLYTAVGGDWRWTMRLEWTWDRWMAWLDRGELETWVAYVAGTPAGYCEMELQPAETVEIVSFGLLPQFIGQGLGGALLTDCVRRAWQFGGRRVWLHTCSLDAPQALAAYWARGFREFQTEEAEGEVPEKAIGPWVGAFPVKPLLP